MMQHGNNSMGRSILVVIAAILAVAVLRWVVPTTWTSSGTQPLILLVPVLAAAWSGNSGLVLATIAIGVFVQSADLQRDASGLTSPEAVQLLVFGLLGAAVAFLTTDRDDPERPMHDLPREPSGFAEMFHQLDAPCCILDVLMDDREEVRDARIAQANLTFEKDCGLTDPIGRTLREINGPWGERCFDTLGRVTRTGGSVRTAGEDGQTEIFACRIGGPNSRRVALMLRETKTRSTPKPIHVKDWQWIQTLLEQMSDYAIYTTDSAGRPTTWSEGVQHVLGFEESEFLGHDIFPLIFTPEDVEKGVHVNELREAEVNGTANDDRWMQRKDGTRFFAMGITAALRDETGTLLGFAKIMRDQTDRKELEDQLRQAAADLSEADRRKTEFLATLGHELRNPLAPIRTGLELMKMLKHDPQALDETRGIMERQVRQIVRLIDDLLDMSKISRGKLELRKTHAVLADIVKSAVESTWPLIDQAGHTLTVTLPKEPVILNCDPHRLAQVFANLLNNSSKFTPDGGHIELSAEMEGGDVVIKVVDDGIGIPREKRQRIFEMFGQIEKGDRSEQGLGIGLTLVKQLVEMHNGSIDVQDRGELPGSEFIVRLPALRGATQDKPVSLPQPAPMPVNPLRILVVDDNQAAANMLSRTVAMLGHECRTAYDGVEGVQVAQEFQPHVVLLDLGMPRMTGYEAIRKLRELPRGKDTVVIALTGWGLEEDKRRTKSAGFDDHLVKPADPADLEKLLAGIDSKRLQADQLRSALQ